MEIDLWDGILARIICNPMTSKKMIAVSLSTCEEEYRARPEPTNNLTDVKFLRAI
jgi:hypothetical protein